MMFFLIIGCAKKEVPPIIEVPKQPPLEEKVSPPKLETKIEERDLTNILGKEEKPISVEKKEDWEHWKLYGRSTPPLLAIFFDYDDFSIKENMWDRIRANVRFLLENSKIKIELQGNCDERGTNEYNMALGMKRALEVKKVLVRLGVEETRVEVVSFGEEKPLCTVSDESCWSINRRVDFVIKGN